MNTWPAASSAESSAAATPAAPAGLQWRTIFMGLPEQRFTAEQLKRALPVRMSLSLWIAAAVNVVLPVLACLAFMAYHGQWAMVASGALFTAGILVAVVRAWRDPSDRWAHRLYYAVPALAGLAFGLGTSKLLSAGSVTVHPASLGCLALMLIAGTYALWFLIAYRHQHVLLRLRELDEQARAVAMAQQLAQAQIRPHFLFNSLAALQHWVHGKDDRAAPMLDALTAFLRATLPMFDRSAIRLGDEEAAVRQYLAVMQHRLGERLRFEVQFEPAARQWLLPPGLVLTLVENAIEHGIQPKLAGGHISVRAHAQGQEAVIEVQDDGAGFDGAEHKPQGGVGLANSRQRLTQAFGLGATLRLSRPGDAAQAGCIARITFPLPSTAPATT
jgi:Histidine kinase/Histidine kinase-, DNA gyrase B-, and HSP90-like ATPase